MGKHKKKATHAPVEASELSKLLEQLMNLTLQDEKFELPRDVLDNFSSVRSLIEQIRTLEKSFDEVPHRNEELLQQMVDWGIRFGCYVRSIAVKKIDDDENYGVFCTESLRDSDIFLSVPLDLMMTSDFATEKSQFGPLLRDDPICSKMSNVCLSLFLLNELAKGEEGFWHFYIRCLPSRYCTVLYFTEDDMKFLSGSTALDSACKMYRSIARQYAYFKRKFLTDPKWKKQPAAKLFTFEAYSMFIFVSYWTLFCCEACRQSYPVNVILLGAFTIGSGIVLSLIVAEYESKSVLEALAICLACFSAVAMWAATTTADVTGMCYLVFIAVVICIITGILITFFPWLNIRKAAAGLGTVAFLMFLATEVQAVQGGKTVALDNDEYLLGALLMYTSVIETFKHFLVLFATKKSR